MSVIFGNLILLALIITAIVILVRIRPSLDKEEKTFTTVGIVICSLTLLGYVLFSLEVFGLAPVLTDYWEGPKDDKLPPATIVAPAPPEGGPMTDKEETAKAIDEQKNRLDAFEGK